MTPSSTNITIQQRILNHLGTLGYGLRLLARLPDETVLVEGYSDGHTYISQVTLGQLEAMLAHSMDQLEAEAQHWQQPAFSAEGEATVLPIRSATS